MKKNKLIALCCVMAFPIGSLQVSSEEKIVATEIISNSQSLAETELRAVECTGLHGTKIEVLKNWILSYESPKMYEFMVKEESDYSEYLSNYVTEDRKSYICNNNSIGTIIAMKNGGMGYNSMTLKYDFEKYGIDYETLQNGDEVSAEIVDEIFMEILKNYRDTVAFIAENDYNIAFTDTQLNAIVFYSYCTGMSRNTIHSICKTYKYNGISEETRRVFYRSWRNMQKESDAIWKAFSEGVQE